MTSARVVFVALAIIVAAPRASAQLSPGPLSTAHAKLDDDDSCGKCHSSGKQIDQPKCLECHTALRKRLDAGEGLHASFGRRPCAECHVEHVGRKARLIRWPGGAPEKLDHAKAGWPLEGKHAEVACASCHDQKTASGTATYLGKNTACAACHKDPHDGKFGATCQTCHNQIDFKRVETKAVDHSKTAFPLTGKHQAVTCKACHGEPARWTGIDFASCSSCHADPHKGKFEGTCESCHTTAGWRRVRGFAAKHPFLSLANGHAHVSCRRCHDKGNEKPPSRGSECVSCHKPVHEASFGTGCKACHLSIKWLGLPRDISLTAHDKTPFPLHGKHDDVPCASCHLPKMKEDKRYRGLSFATCAACHRDPHPRTVRAIGGDCRACHSDAGFVPSTFEVALHAKTGFTLDGGHEATPCSSCHTGTRPRTAFNVTAKDCAACHANPHGNQFKAEMEQGGCARCHTTASFAQVKVDHSKWPLTGVHATTSCGACHGGGVYAGTPRQCEGCHADIHAGQFRLNAPVKACDACHTTERFAGFAADRHEAMTGYALSGKHAAAKCEACHKPEALHNGQSVVRWRLGYRSCRACHADPHGGKS